MPTYSGGVIALLENYPTLKHALVLKDVYDTLRGHILS